MSTIFSVFFTGLMLVASLALHEWAHIFAVRFMGGKIEKAGFFPLGMMAKVYRPETLHSWERYVIYVSGAGANFALALWAFATSHISYVGVAWLDELAFYNIVLGVFNLTPVLPLDGGRVFLQFLGNRIGILRANRVLIRFGLIIGYAFIFLGLLQVLLFPYNITLLCAGIYIKQKNKKIAPELTAAFYLALDGKNSPHRSRTLPIMEIPLPRDTKIKNALERLSGDYFITFLIDGIKERPLREQTLINYIFKTGINGTVGDILSFY